MFLRRLVPIACLSLSSLASCGGGDAGLFEQAASDAGVDQSVDSAADGSAGADGGGCVAACLPGQLRCQSGQLQACVAGVTGCGLWDAPKPCPSDKPFCSEGQCEATCSHECSEGERRCQGTSAWQLCSTVGGCRVWGVASQCAPGETCNVADGTCALLCDGGACGCEPGQTLACDDLGACTGGQRTCVSGQFGPCVWQNGPSAEVCNGQDDDCNGAVDDGLIAPVCSKSVGVCSGAQRTCTGSGWVDCTDAVYASHAASKGLGYQPVEAACDGQDNDCDGLIDEPSGCCQPSCAGKACGADNGCGYPCLAGSCPQSNQVCSNGVCVCQPSCAGKACGADNGCGAPCATGTCSQANQTCVSGVCQCQWTACGSACCASAEQCIQAACCKPSCGTKVCGPDPVCGTSCGTCAVGSSCNAQGQCVSGPTWKAESSPVSTDLYAVWGASKTNVWAVGAGGVILHYTGGQWDTVASGVTELLKGIWGNSASDIWAVGGAGKTTHFNGSQWTVTPSPVTEAMSDVWGTPGSMYYAVGDSGRVMSWTGSAWATCCNYTANAHTNVWGRSGNDFLFGGYEKLYRVTSSNTYVHSFPYSSLTALHGNASQTWIAVRGSTQSELKLLTGDYFSTKYTDGYTYSAMWVTGTGEVWAVGKAIVHFDGTNWVKVQTGLAQHLYGLWGDASGELFAVGAGGTILHYH